MLGSATDIEIHSTKRQKKSLMQNVKASSTSTPQSHRSPSTSTPQSHRSPSTSTPQSHRSPSTSTPQSHQVRDRVTNLLSRDTKFTTADRVSVCVSLSIIF